MKRCCRISVFIFKYLLSNVIAFFIKLLCPSMRDVWIVSERGDDARDNGYFFFKYLREKSPKKKVYYVIKRKSADYPKVALIGDTLEPNSFRHFVFFGLARVCISSSAWGGDLPQAYYIKKLQKIVPIKKKIVFLQHGIIKDFLPSLTYPYFRPNIFICGAQPEFTYVNSYFGHPSGVVQYTGLARFDNLHMHKEKNQILVMPTFRKWLQGITQEEFLQSEYYHMWNSLLNDPRVEQMLSNTGMNLVFYPHYEMQKYVDCFKSNSKNIVIADFAHFDVQQLLMESKLLITDFSSVFFDFAYMEKPVIYYQFDRERYIKHHYDFTKGYFDYDTMGFGEVVYTTEKLIDSILRIEGNFFCLAEEYKERVQYFFQVRDKKNCERIYHAIQKIQ